MHFSDLIVVFLFSPEAPDKVDWAEHYPELCSESTTPHTHTKTKTYLLSSDF